MHGGNRVSGQGGGGRPSRDRRFASHLLQQRVRVSREFAFPFREPGVSPGARAGAGGVVGGDGRGGPTRRQPAIISLSEQVPYRSAGGVGGLTLRIGSRNFDLQGRHVAKGLDARSAVGWASLF